MDKPKKVPGPIRWNAIIPFALFSLIVAVYMHFFFDHHLKNAAEWVGYKAVGAEVNIEKIHTSFLSASIEIKKVELTNAASPDYNSLEIGDIRFSMLWDALLRAKAVINEVAVEKIAFGTKRAFRGKVKPPEPPSTGPGVGSVVKDQAIEFVQDQYSENVLGDIANVLKGGDAGKELQKIQDSLPSKAKLKALEENFKTKQAGWDKKIKSLPQGPEIKALGDRLGKIKTKDFKTPQELEASIKEFDSLFKEADAKLKAIKSTTDEFQSDLKQVEMDLRDVEKQIKEDLKTLEAHFRLPKLDAKVLSKAIFSKYLGPYMAKVDYYKSLAFKYIPPNLLKKKEKVQDPGQAQTQEEDFKAHPREKGTSYEFGRAGSYPLFWLKVVSISSKAGSSPGAGDLSGKITDITSHQKLVGRPTVLDIQGGFPENQIQGLKLQVSLDATREESLINYLFAIESYPLVQKALVESGEVQLVMSKAQGSLHVDGSLVGFKKMKLNLKNDFKNVEYQVEAKDANMAQLLKNIFSEVKAAKIKASVEGELPKVDLYIASDIGELLEQAFNKELQAKIAELRMKAQKAIDDEVGKQKAIIEKQINMAKTQVEQEIKKVQDQLDLQKKQVQGKSDQAKHDAENKAKSKLDQAKKDAEAQVRKNLDADGQKKLDDLKKKFGF